MSEARHEGYPEDPEKKRLSDELRQVQSLRFFKHNRALLDDALQRQAISAAEAREKGLKFVDIYTQETSVSVPHDRAIAVLLTPDGDWLRPNHAKPHFFIYFSTLESSGDDNEQPSGLLNWIEKVDAEGISTMYTLTEDGIQRSLGLEESLHMIIEGSDQQLISHRMTEDLFDELRSFRLAPHDHAAIKQ